MSTIDFFSLFGTHEPTDLLFVCGAGISYPPPSRLPTVGAFIRTVASLCTDRTTTLSALSTAVRSSRLSPRFEVLIDEIRKLNDPELAVGAIFDSQYSNSLHRVLAHVCARGAGILTTNFDNCIEQALSAAHYTRVVFDGRDLTFDPPLSRVIVKPHGSNPASTEPRVATSLLISIQALARTASGFLRFPRWRQYLLDLIRDRLIVVVGYSGSDDFDITPVLLASRPRRVIWVAYDPGASPPREAPLSPATANVRRFAATLPLSYYRGSLEAVAPAIVGAPEGPVTTAFVEEASGSSIQRYLAARFPTAAHRKELLNQLLLHYDLHSVLIRCNPRPRSRSAVLQKAKAYYRVSRYRAACRTLARLRSIVLTRLQRSEMLYFYSASLYHLGRLGAAYRTARRQYELTVRTKDVVAQVNALNNLGAIAFAREDLGTASLHYHAALRLQRRTPFIEGKGTSLWGLADVTITRGHFRRAVELYREAGDVYSALGNRFNLAWIERNIGEALIDAGDTTEAKTWLASSEERFAAVRSRAGQIYVCYSFAKLHYREAELEPAHDRILRALRHAGSDLSFPLSPEILLLGLLVCAAGGDRRRYGKYVAGYGKAFFRRCAGTTVTRLRKPEALLCKLLGSPSEWPSRSRLRTMKQLIFGDSKT